MGEQAADMAGRVTERATDMAGNVVEHASDLAQTVREKAHDLRDKAQDLGAQASEAISDSAAAMAHRPETTFNDARRSAGDMSSRAISVVGDTETRDALLLGAAGLAVAAALGIAYQRRAD
jgi:seryl-tRNA synthetase